jgi:small-conductance mechanosensitive channel
LEFTLFAYTYDITKAQALRTELRLQILEALEKADIETPFRQKTALPAPAAEEPVGEEPESEEAPPEPQSLLRPRQLRST